MNRRLGGDASLNAAIREDGDFGEWQDRLVEPGLGAVRGAFFRQRCAAPAWGGWLKDPAKSGGGVFDLLIHDVDMCVHLFGSPKRCRPWVTATSLPD